MFPRKTGARKKTVVPKEMTLGRRPRLTGVKENRKSSKLACDTTKCFLGMGREEKEGEGTGADPAPSKIMAALGHGPGQRREEKSTCGKKKTDVLQLPSGRDFNGAPISKRGSRREMA